MLYLIAALSATQIALIYFVYKVAIVTAVNRKLSLQHHANLELLASEAKIIREKVYNHRTDFERDTSDLLAKVTDLRKIAFEGQNTARDCVAKIEYAQKQGLFGKVKG